MARRKRFPRGVRKIVERFIAPVPREEVPPPSPEPLPQRETPVPSPGATHERRMQQDYRDIHGTLTEYLDWREIYDQLTVIFDDDAEIEYYWDMFLRAFMLPLSDNRSVPREQFYRETGVPPSEIDWGLWRDVMGYANRAR